MGGRPSHGLDELLDCGPKQSKIVEMLAGWCSVNGRMQLEADQVKPGCNMDRKCTESVNVGSLGEAVWKPRWIHYVRCDRVEPVLADPRGNSDLVGCLRKLLWQWICLQVGAVLHQRDHIEILSRSHAEPPSRRLLPPIATTE